MSIGHTVYLAVILDAYSRKVVGWELDRTLAARLVISALEKAITERRPPPGLAHHSDRGVQYACDEYVRILNRHGMIPSMSRPANPYDNASCKSFMKTLKREEIYAGQYQDLNDLCRNIEAFIEEYYNRQRLHSALGYRPPEEFESLADSEAAAAGARMSFPRHGEIYPPDVQSRTGSGSCPLPALIGTDESPAGYSSVGCTPAAPTSASPAEGNSGGNHAG
jgi:hypothetical protein